MTKFYLVIKKYRKKYSYKVSRNLLKSLIYYHVKWFNKANMVFFSLKVVFNSEKLDSHLLS